MDSEEKKKSSYFWNVVVKEHPIAARAFVFLRHGCPPELMTDDGKVILKIVLDAVIKEMGQEIDEKTLMEHINIYNAGKTEHRMIHVVNTDNNVLLQVKSCHSIKKVNSDKQNNSQRVFVPKKDQKGYVFLRSDKPNYVAGSDLAPRKNRNDVCIKLRDNHNHNHYAMIEIDLNKLKQSVELYHLDSGGIYIRGAVPASCINFRLLQH